MGWDRVQETEKNHVPLGKAETFFHVFLCKYWFSALLPGFCFTLRFNDNINFSDPAKNLELKYLNMAFF